MRPCWKKRIAPAVLLCMMLSWKLPAAAGAQEPLPPEQVTVYIDQQKADWEQAPYIEQGSTMVPMRALFEKLGFTVSWDDETRSAIAKKGELTLILAIDKNTASVNQITYYLDASPVLQDGSTYIPLRFVSAAAGADVQWDGDTRTVSIQLLHDAEASIHQLIEQVTQSSSFLQRAASITEGSSIKRNEVMVKSVQMNAGSDAADVSFEVEFTVTRATQTDHGLVISPAASAVYSLTCEVYKDSAEQWLLRSDVETLPFELKEQKPFTE